MVAASKMNDSARVQAAIRAGIRDCGENRCQELVDKYAQGAYEGAKLHYIGHLQKNKLNKLIGVCELIQSVDSTDMLSAISQRALAKGIRQNVLVEVNIGREANKSGALPEAVDELMAAAAELDGIVIKGIMSIPPRQEGNGQISNYFDKLCKIYVDTAAKKYDNTDMCVLSMGMSSDFEDAILAGANMVRIGSAIFGQRHY